LCLLQAQPAQHDLGVMLAIQQRLPEHVVLRA
jgi:hypothetical protein